MIRQWEILHAPSVSDPYRHRLSLWSDAGDVEKLRSVFPQRTGVVWVPRRKPYNCAFFLYRLSQEEKLELENLLSGKTAFPEKAAASSKKKSIDDTGEIEALVTGDEGITGLGRAPVSGPTSIGYFVPDYLADAGDRIQEILERTLYEKKVSVAFQKKFTLPYRSLSLSQIHWLIDRCREQSVKHAIAVGDPGHLQSLKKMAKSKGIYVRILPEAVIDKNLWLTVVAEMLSHD